MKWTITDIDEARGCITATFVKKGYQNIIKQMKAPIYSDKDTLVAYMNDVARQIENDIPVAKTVSAEVTALIGKEQTVEVAIEK